MLTDAKDLVVDPFTGSCVTGEVCQKLHRRWVCIDLIEDYLRGAIGRFQRDPEESTGPRLQALDDEEATYKIPRAGIFWNGVPKEPLPQDGVKKRPTFGVTRGNK